MGCKVAKLWGVPQGYIGRAERIRTSDPLLPKQVRYQAALQPDRDGRDIATCADLQGPISAVLHGE